MNYCMDVIAENGVSFRVVFLPFGKSDNFPAANTDRQMVEFYDLRYKFTSDGQFISRYYLEDIITDQMPFGGIVLDYNIEAWWIDGDTFDKIVGWLASFEVKN